MKKVFLALIIFLLLPVATLAQESDTEAKAETTESALKTKKIFGKDISFSEGTFLGKVNTFFVKHTAKIEVWREKQKVSLDGALIKLEKKRAAEPEAKSVIKAMTFLHFCVLVILLFIFSLQFVFYTILIVIALFILKKILSYIIGLFRRNPERG